MNPFRRIVTLGHNARVIFEHWRRTEREETVKQWSEGNIQCDALFWCWARSNPPPGCLWQLWRSASTLTEPLHPNRIFSCWCDCNCYLLNQFTQTQYIVTLYQIHNGHGVTRYIDHHTYTISAGLSHSWDLNCYCCAQIFVSFSKM